MVEEEWIGGLEDELFGHSKGKGHYGELKITILDRGHCEQAIEEEPISWMSLAEFPLESQARC